VSEGIGNTESALDDILSKNWEELEALEHAGYLLFPAILYRKRADGTLEKLPICLRVLRPYERREARTAARVIAAEDHLDPKLDPDLFDDLDTVCLLSHAIRNRTHPHERFVPDPRELERDYDERSLDLLWGQHQAYRRLLDPRPKELSDAETVALIAAIAKEQTIGPLVAIGGAEQESLVITMASLLQGSLSSNSSSPSSETSTPEP
jgi:hypothetical protein